MYAFWLHRRNLKTLLGKRTSFSVVDMSKDDQVISAEESRQARAFTLAQIEMERDALIRGAWQRQGLNVAEALDALEAKEKAVRTSQEMTAWAS